jgi:O-antigen/teichoic acid export membrane protein
VKLCEAWYFVPIVITASLFPAILSTRQKNKPLYQDRLQKLYDLMVWGSVAVAIPTTLIADWLILILYGNEFEDAADVLRIYIWAGVFVALGVASSKWLIAENLEKYSFYRTVLGGILNVGCNFWLIPIYGIKGAAYATLIAQGSVSFASLALYSKTRKNFWTAVNSLNAYGAYKRIFH